MVLPAFNQKTARIGSPKPLQRWVQAFEQAVDEKWHSFVDSYVNPLLNVAQCE